MLNYFFHVRGVEKNFAEALHNSHSLSTELIIHNCFIQ